MAEKKIKVLAGKGLVPVLSTLHTTTPRRFIGFRFDAEKHGYVKTDEPEEVSATSHNIQMVREGALVPFDKESADICGVKFNNK